MKIKGNVKKGGKMPDFWGKYKGNVTEEFKEWIYMQYYCIDTLHIYCDASGSKDKSEMSIGCCYLFNGIIAVKHQLVHPPRECFYKIIYGEIKAVMFALSTLYKFLKRGHENVVIYSDVFEIEYYLSMSKEFKNPKLKHLQLEMISLYEKVKQGKPNLSIKICYLPVECRKHNPYAKSSHNAAIRLLRRL